MQTIKENKLGISLILISYLPILGNLFMGYAPETAVIKVISHLAFINFFWLIVSGFREGFLHDILTVNAHNKLHTLLGPTAFVFVMIHPVLMILKYKSLAVVLPILNPYSFWIGMGTVSFLILCITVGTSYLIRKKHYRLWNITHYLNYVFFILVFLHFHDSFDRFSPNGIYLVSIFSLGMIAIAFKMFFDLKILSFKIKVKQIKEVAEDTYSITFEYRENFMKYWQAGQYIMLSRKRFNQNHAFSISKIDRENKEIEITFKVLGNFTMALKDIKEGDDMFICGSFGNLHKYLRKAELSHSNIVLIAGGIGITPFRSMINEILAKDPSSKLKLIYGVRSQSYAAFDEELKDLGSKNENFKVIKVVEKDPTANDIKGFITPDIIKENVEDLNSTKFFVCGPPVMMDIMNKHFKELSIPTQNIFIEKFGY